MPRRTNDPSTLTRTTQLHSVIMRLPMHADLAAWLDAKATEQYVSPQELVRRFIVDAMRSDGAGK
jgi:hypothetical protein